MRRKRCPRCGFVRVWADFYAKLKWPDGTMRQPQSYCKDCMGERYREAYRADPEKYRALRRVHYWRNREAELEKMRKRRAKRRNDAERMAVERDQDRSRRPLEIRRGPRVLGPPSQSPVVPAEPLAEWLRAYSGRYLYLAETAGVNERWLTAVRTGERVNIELDAVDRVLLAADDGTRLDDLYP